MTPRLAIIAVAAIAACSADGDSFEPGASLPTTEPISSESTSSGRSTRTEAEAPTTTLGADVATTSIVTPPAIDASPTTDPATTSTVGDGLAPTPQTPGFEFPPAGLPTDPDSPSNNRAIRPEDQPVLDAYLAATEAQNRALAEWPLDPNHPLLVTAPFTESALSLFEDGLAGRTAANQVLDISGGLTPRPYVVGGDGDPDRAIVFDCQIDATFWKDVDTGEPAPPDAFPNVGPPGVEIGTETVMVRVAGEWLVDSGTLQPQACA